MVFTYKPRDLMVMFIYYDNGDPGKSVVYYIYSWVLSASAILRYGILSRNFF